MVIQISGDVIDVTARGVHIKDLPDNGSLMLFDDRIFIRGFGVSQWHLTIIETLAGAGEHGTADFPGEVDGVELILPLNDHFNEAAIHAVNQRLTDGYHIDSELFPEHGLVESTLVLIPGKPAELPQDNDIEGLRLGAIIFWKAYRLLDLRPERPSSSTKIYSDGSRMLCCRQYRLISSNWDSGEYSS